MQAQNRLTQLEEKIIRDQIKKNSKVIDWLVYKVDLLMNKEGHKRDSDPVVALREKMSVLTAENDTFRKVLWRHVEQEESLWDDPGAQNAFRYLVVKVKEKKKASKANVAAEYEIGTTSLTA